jgi:8-oxo-dGTP pyrophosphatase MutT (NUDIX family)
MSEPVPARPASTVLLLRDGVQGLEVFMVVRHHQIDFASGALVFPGGRVEASDQVLAGGDAEAAFRVAAIRETWEECGVPARGAGHGAGR